MKPKNIHQINFQLTSSTGQPIGSGCFGNDLAGSKTTPRGLASASVELHCWDKGGVDATASESQGGTRDTLGILHFLAASSALERTA